MARAPILEANVPSLEPVDALRGEQTQLESWVHQSFAALERLHSELNEWQMELTRQQAEFDKKNSSTDANSDQGHYLKQISDLQEELEKSQKEISRLVEEVSAQTREYEELNRHCATVQAELDTVRKHTEQITFTLESERQQEVSERQQRNEEAREMRKLMDRQCRLMEQTPQGASSSSLDDPLVTISEPEAQSNQPAPKPAKDDCDEIRLRAKKRRAANRRKRINSD